MGAEEWEQFPEAPKWAGGKSPFGVWPTENLQQNLKLPARHPFLGTTELKNCQGKSKRSDPLLSDTERELKRYFFMWVFPGKRSDSAV